MAAPELVTSCFVQMDGFLASLGLAGKRDKETVRFATLLKKCRVPVGSNPAKVPLSEQRAAIRATCIAIPLSYLRLMPVELLDDVHALLAAERSSAALVDAMSLPLSGPNVVVWQGDMSILRCDAVVNPANVALLGCFLPPHRCLDNILHAQSGPRLRLACGELLDKLNVRMDREGECRVTSAFELPAQYVLHTVGPNLVEDPKLPPRPVTPEDAEILAACYRQCYRAAIERRLQSIAFCCISTGVFGYPAEDAARLAAVTVREEMRRMEGTAPAGTPPLRVIFNVFKDEDLAIYQRVVPEVFGSVDATPEAVAA